MTATDRYVGEWADLPAPAMSVAIAAVGLSELDFITCEHSDGQFTLVPVDPDGRWEVSVEVGYSESRDQYRATLRRIPHVDREDA